MATKEDVRKLAALARIAIADAELDAFTKDFDSILTYVGQLDALELPHAGATRPAVRNVMREDGTPHETGKYTERLVAQFPQKDGDYLEVKQIIAHD